MIKKYLHSLWLVPPKWTRRFIISHITGWITATLQTVWIVYEVRRAAVLLKRVIERGQQQCQQKK